MTHPAKENAPAATGAIFKNKLHRNSNRLLSFGKQFMPLRVAQNPSSLPALEIDLSNGSGGISILVKPCRSDQIAGAT